MADRTDPVAKVNHRGFFVVEKKTKNAIGFVGQLRTTRSEKGNRNKKRKQIEFVYEWERYVGWFLAYSIARYSE